MYTLHTSIYLRPCRSVYNPYWLLKLLVKCDERQKTEEINSSIWHAHWLEHIVTGQGKKCLDSQHCL